MKRTPFDDYISDAENRGLLNQEELVLEFTEAICEYMAEHEINRKDLAERMGKSKGFVSQVLNGSRNLTLHTLADIFQALDVKATVRLQGRLEASDSINQIADSNMDEPVPADRWKVRDITDYRTKRLETFSKAKKLHRLFKPAVADILSEFPSVACG